MNQLQLFAVDHSGPVALPVPTGATGFDDLYSGLSLGVYSALRTFEHNKFLYLTQHLERTRQSMALLDWGYALDETALRQALHLVCTAYPGREMRVRFDVLAKPATLLGTDSRLLIGLAPFSEPPQSYYERGVSVAFAEGLNRENPLVKTAGFAEVRKAHASSQLDVYERLLVEADGSILEGTSSNFYAIRHGTLFTANKGILEGITRRILLDRMAELAIPVNFTPITVDEVNELDEAAISSSSRALMPVVNIGGQVIGDGEPGPISKRILDAYNDFVGQTVRTAIE